MVSVSSKMLTLVPFLVLGLSGCAEPGSARECIDLALSQFNHQRYAEALELCDRAIQLEPDRFEGYNMRAIVHQGLGDSQSSIDDWTKAIELAPDDASRASMFTCRSFAFDAIGDQMSRAKDLVEAERLK